MKTSLKTLATTAVLVLGCSAQADVLTFDDITTRTVHSIGNSGYGGFDWNSNSYVLNANSGSYQNTGYNAGLSSGNYAAFNGWGRDTSSAAAAPLIGTARSWQQPGTTA